MAGPAKSGRMTRLRWIVPALLILCAPVCAQAGLTLRRQCESSEPAGPPTRLPISNQVFDSIGSFGSRTQAATPAFFLFPAAGLVAILLIFMLQRERHLRQQRERLRKTYQLGEDVLGSSSSESILKRLGESLPPIMGVSRVHLYVH